MFRNQVFKGHDIDHSTDWAFSLKEKKKKASSPHDIYVPCQFCTQNAVSMGYGVG